MIKIFNRESIRKAFLYLNTISYLKKEQIIYRLISKIRKIDENIDFNFSINTQKAHWIRCELLKSCYISDNEITFLNRVDSPNSWNDEALPKLWTYNLHYFDDLNSFDAKSRKNFHLSLIDDWINKNPVNFGNGWEPYPLSLRIVNFIKYNLSYNTFTDDINESLYLQVYVLSQKLEYHLLGNHLFANAKALVFAGCYFDSGISNKWLKKGIEILDKEISEQILNDGGNFELSPMYHNIILADMLDLYNITLTYNKDILISRRKKWKKIILKMISYSQSMNHPDGKISFFNDSAFSIAPTTSKLIEYANRLGISDSSILENTYPTLNHFYFEDSGYIIVESEDIKSIIDVAKIGPDYIPGHGHADTLSFELSLFGQRLFVNSGTSEYGLSEERLRQRKTASHNTVEIDNVDSSEVWSGFRVARRAYPKVPEINQDGESISIVCSHNGYERLSNKVIHKRKWVFNKSTVEIIDKVEGDFQNAVAHYHIHPDIEVRGSENNAYLKLPCGREVIIESSLPLKVSNTTWHPEFGVIKKNKKITISITSPELRIIVKY